YAYDYPCSFWKINNAYEAAEESGNYSDIINYGTQVVNLIRNEPLNEQTADVMGSRLYVMGNAYEQLGEYDMAADCFEEYIQYGEYRGWDDGVKIAKAKALQFTSTVDVYTETSETQKYYGAINEPEKGTLIGQTSDSETKNEESMILLYQEYGQSLNSHVTAVLDKAQKSGRAVEFALNFPYEGAQLDDIINDTSFLPKLVNLLQSYNSVPVYLRIGAEMNIWTSYAEPEKYKQAFRKIADEVHYNTFNVAIVWSVGHTSSWNINMDDYYPGDEYVDWVGISAYCNKYFEGKVWDVENSFNEVYFKSGDSADPVLLIKEVADKYGDRKPLMFSEGGVAHLTSSDSVYEEHTQWAIDKMEYMYNYVPMVYPQVKLMAYFNKYISSEANEYALSRNAELSAKYDEMLSLPHFIKSSYGASPEYVYKSAENASAGDSITLYAYPHIYGDVHPKVDYYIDGNWAASSSSVPYKCVVNLSDYAAGAHELKAVVESGGKVMTEKSYTIYSGGSENTSGSSDEINIKINGKYVSADVAPFIENDRTYVPVRLISENLGCDVTWEQDVQTAVLSRDDTNIRMTLGSGDIIVNGETRHIDSEAKMKNDRLFLPIRAVSEILGADVDWDGSERCVIVEG
ncbi:MAG: hypothetical protein LIO59_01110, partial [Oscillospiraceae bacterium]|nr:hypothetical protein [Oscillospiraceae bacterium]